jgi:hypothetical protein
MTTLLWWRFFLNKIVFLLAVSFVFSGCSRFRAPIASPGTGQNFSTDLAASANAQPAPTNLTAYKRGEADVVYAIARNGHLIQAEWTSALGWHAGDLSAITNPGNPTSLAGGLASYQEPSDEAVFGIDGSGNLIEFEWTASGWGEANLSALVGAPPLLPTGGLSAYSATVYGIGVSGHLLQFKWTSAAGWGVTDLSLLTSPANPSVFAGGVSAYPADGAENVFSIRPGDGHLIQFQWTTRGWGVVDISQLTGLVFDPKGGIVALSQPSVGSIYGLSASSGDLMQAQWTQQLSWQGYDISTLSGGAPALLGGVTGYVTPEGIHDIFVYDQDRQVRQFQWSPALNWINANLSVAVAPGNPFLFMGGLAAYHAGTADNFFGITPAGILLQGQWTPTQPWGAVNLSVLLNPSAAVIFR